VTLLAFSYFSSLSLPAFLSFSFCLLRLQVGAILRHRRRSSDGRIRANLRLAESCYIVGWLKLRCVLSGVLWCNKGITAFLFGALSHTAAKEDSIRETFNAQDDSEPLQRC
jgi:hypothetical protein